MARDYRTRTYGFGDLISYQNNKEDARRSFGRSKSVSEYSSSCIDMRADEALISAMSDVSRGLSHGRRRLGQVPETM